MKIFLDEVNALQGHTRLDRFSLSQQLGFEQLFSMWVSVSVSVYGVVLCFYWWDTFDTLFNASNGTV